MNKWYFGIPFALLIAFWVYYLGFNKEYEANEQAKVEAKIKEREDKERDRREAQAKIIEEARATSERRKKELEEENARKAKEAEERELMKAKRDKAQGDLVRLNNDVTRLEREIGEEQQAIEKIQGQIKIDQDEKKHLAAFVPKVESNARRMLDLVAKVDDAEKKAAEAAASAASDGKKKRESQ